MPNNSRAPEFVVVVPVFNAREYLERTIPPILEALDRVQGELIVMDNGSTDGSVEWLCVHAGSATIESRPGLTIGALRNEGVRRRGGDILSFIDADCVVPPDYFLKIEEVLRDTEADAVGSRYRLPDDPVWIEHDWYDLNQRRTAKDDGPAKYIPSGNFSCRTAAFEAVGGFDEGLITGEDAELCLRLRERASVIWESYQIEAKHLGNPKSLLGFYRKQRWHGLGMFGTARRDPFDKPTILTFFHILANVVGFALLITVGGWVGAACLAVLTCVAPALAVGFRIAQSYRPRSLPRALLLFHLYLDGRIAALCAIIGQRLGRGT